MNEKILKDSVRITRINAINYLLDSKNKRINNKPWLGELFSFLYDRIMAKSVFPNKFNASIEEHYKILNQIFNEVSGKRVLEFATGSGDAVKFLKTDNSYSGVDISTGLLRLARKKFDKNGFNDCELYSADACKTPFEANIFDVAICNLSLNFFHDVNEFISELSRVLKANGVFYCSVPVPERKKSKAKINGNLYKLDELKKMFGNYNFLLEPLPYGNGALLYFKAVFAR